jgi:hypothetical protein
MWDNVTFKYHDKGIGEWDLSGRQANVKEFHTTKAMYTQKEAARAAWRHVRDVGRGTEKDD